MNKLTTPVSTSPSIRIGEFLQILEVISPDTLDETLSAAQELDIPIGRATVLRGLLSNEELNNLVQLHCLVRNNDVTLEQAKEAFSMSRRKGWSLKDALLAIGCPVDEFGIVKIGELLMEADLLAERELDMALSLQGLCGLPLGRILTIDARIPTSVVTEALNLQRDVREKKRHVGDAIKRLRRKSGVWKVKSSAVEHPGLDRPMYVDLEALLIVGKVCAESDLTPARSFAVANRLPVQEVLKGLHWLDSGLLSAASALSGLVRDGYIAGDDAIIMLRSLGDTKFNHDRSGEMASKARFLSLYQFLVMSGFLTPDDIRQLVRSLVSDPVTFAGLVGARKEDFKTKLHLKRAVIKCITDNTKLEFALISAFNADKKHLAYARDLVCLISFGAASVDQAILSFARMRHFSEKKKERS